MHLGSACSKFCMFIFRGFNFRKHQTSVLAKARDPTLSTDFSINGWTAKMFYHSLLYISALQCLFSCSISALGPILQMKIPYCKLSFCPHPLSSHCQRWEIMGNVILGMKEWKTLSNPISSALSSCSCTSRRMVQTAQLWIIRAENINCLVVESDALSARIVP